MKKKDLASLLNRAAAVIETSTSETIEEKKQLVGDLTAYANEVLGTQVLYFTVALECDGVVTVDAVKESIYEALKYHRDTNGFSAPEDPGDVNSIEVAYNGE